MSKTKYYHQWQRVQRTPIPADEKRRQERNKATFNSKEFDRLCLYYGVKPTTRQASKFNRKKGLLYKLYTQGEQHEAQKENPKDQEG